MVDCAVKWKDLDGYESWLVERLDEVIADL